MSIKRVFQQQGVVTLPKVVEEPPLFCAVASCGKQLISRDASYSIVVVMAERGGIAGAPSFQTCPHPDDLRQGYRDGQHFCCSPECARIAAHACIDEHLLPTHYAHITQLQLDQGGSQ